jgi:putative tryptophan/tyrosine transport system substrate-binding protein
MKRREFIAGLGSAAAWSAAARSQQGMRHIGILVRGADDELMVAFHQSLERLGWLQGRNVRVDTRNVIKTDEFEQRAREMVALRPEVIFAQTTPVVAALQRETGTIPIVFCSVSDPLGAGFVASLARPGGNITGFLLYEDSIVGKWLSMLKEISPRLTRAAFIANPKDMPYEYFLRSAEAAARVLSIELVPYRVGSVDDIEKAVASFALVPNGGLVFPADAMIRLNRDRVVALAARHGLPAVYALRTFVPVGGLMSYSTDLSDMFRNAATYVDRILRGEKPADLPVQAPTKYETGLNLRTAKELGLTVPDLMIVRADTVIE